MPQPPYAEPPRRAVSPGQAYTFVEWDPERELIVSLYARDQDGNLVGNPQETGAPSDPGVTTEEKRLVTMMPETFIERFPRLLGVASAHVDPDDPSTVVMEYPDADYSESAVREELKRMAREDANKILSGTDWYAVRQFETGKSIPGDVLQMRNAVRREIDDIERRIDGIRGQALITHTWEFASVPAHDQHRP